MCAKFHVKIWFHSYFRQGETNVHKKELSMDKSFHEFIFYRIPYVDNNPDDNKVRFISEVLGKCQRFLLLS